MADYYVDQKVYVPTPNRLVETKITKIGRQYAHLHIRGWKFRIDDPHRRISTEYGSYHAEIDLAVLEERQKRHRLIDDVYRASSNRSRLESIPTETLQSVLRLLTPEPESKPDDPSDSCV